MKRWILIGMVVASGMTIQAQNKLPEKFPYQDTSLTAEERADDLLKRLTLEEKASLMMNGSPAIPRLSIKAYGWWNEALHGLARTGLATVFPQAIGMGASFDDSLLYEVFTAVSDEARAKSRRLDSKGNLTRYQALTVWTPNVNIFRDPRWGQHLSFMFMVRSGVGAEVLHPRVIPGGKQMVAVRLGVFGDQVAVLVGQRLPEVQEGAALFQCDGREGVVDLTQALFVEAGGLLAHFRPDGGDGLDVDLRVGQRLRDHVQHQPIVGEEAGIVVVGGEHIGAQQDVERPGLLGG